MGAFQHSEHELTLQKCTVVVYDGISPGLGGTWTARTKILL